MKLTRDTDVDVYAPNDSAHDELQARVDVANKAGARLFVSIHANAFINSGPYGTTCYISKPDDVAFAQIVETHLASDGTKDDGIIKSHLYVTLHTRMPAVLIETAFLSNPGDYALLDVVRVAAKGRARDRRRHRAIRAGIPRPQSARAVADDRALRLGAWRPDRPGARARTDCRRPTRSSSPIKRTCRTAIARTRVCCELLRANLARLDEYGVDAIVMACNTSCAIAERYGWPQSRAPVLDLIESAAIAVERGGFRRVGVVATAATVGAGSYGRTLRARIGGHRRRRSSGAGARSARRSRRNRRRADPRAAVAEVCSHLPLDLDALVFGCTHYPCSSRTSARCSATASR